MTCMALMEVLSVCVPKNRKAPDCKTVPCFEGMMKLMYNVKIVVHLLENVRCVVK